jgi:hypothetical protein
MKLVYNDIYMHVFVNEHHFPNEVGMETFVCYGITKNMNMKVRDICISGKAFFFPMIDHDCMSVICILFWNFLSIEVLCLHLLNFSSIFPYLMHSLCHYYISLVASILVPVACIM